MDSEPGRRGRKWKVDLADDDKRWEMNLADEGRR
jgi:hypothetical protein